MIIDHYFHKKIDIINIKVGFHQVKNDFDDYWSFFIERLTLQWLIDSLINTINIKVGYRQVVMIILTIRLWLFMNYWSIIIELPDY